MLIVLFLVSHFNFLFVPCGGLSWLTVSFLLHVKHTLSYRIVTTILLLNIFTSRPTCHDNCGADARVDLLQIQWTAIIVFHKNPTVTRSNLISVNNRRLSTARKTRDTIQVQSANTHFLTDIYVNLSITTIINFAFTTVK